MDLNPKISDWINMWNIEFDPYGFLKNENWLEGSALTEDILQIHQIYADGPILDVGWYEGKYRVVVVQEDSWDNPIEILESNQPPKIKDAVYSWLNKYQNGL